ncbi:MAG: hypothetical protein L0219_10810 [Phycisphaerales bacterium]|nr:hypothetical protein [Phycisphaerales bacterium]
MARLRRTFRLGLQSLGGIGVRNVVRSIDVLEPARRGLRSRATTIIGKPFYIYAARKPGELSGFAELGCEPGDLPTGVIVGTATISKCTRDNGNYEWHLADGERLDKPY